jgi:WD40 repeat protein
VQGAAVKGIAVGEGGRIVAAGDDTGRVHLWRGDATPMTLTGHENQVWALALSPDGRMLASADRSGEVIVRDTESAAIRHRVKTRNGAIWWTGFTGGGTTLATASDTGVELWNVATMERTAEFPQDGGHLTRAAVSPDGTLLATSSSDGRVRILDLAEGRETREIPVIDDAVWSVSFSPDGRQLAVAASDEVVSLWDVATGERRASFAGHSGGATDAAFLSDGVTLAAVDRHGQLHLWDTLSGRRLAPPIRAHAGASWRLAAAADDDIFVTTGDDGVVRSWDALSIGRACEIGSRAFDRERHREYFGDSAHSLACAGVAP